MNTLRNYIGGLISLLVGVGILKGLGESNIGEGADLGEIASSIINGVADLTIRIIPTIIDALGSITS